MDSCSRWAIAALLPATKLYTFHVRVGRDPNPYRVEAVEPWHPMARLVRRLPATRLLEELADADIGVDAKVWCHLVEPVDVVVRVVGPANAPGPQPRLDLGGIALARTLDRRLSGIGHGRPPFGMPALALGPNSVPLSHHTGAVKALPG